VTDQPDDDLWERHADWWQDGFTDGVDPEYEEQILPLAVECLSGARRVLDVGCGEGQLSRLAAGLGGVERVVGVDPTWAQVEVAVERALTGEIRGIDLARVGEAYCVGYAGAGFDSDATRFANEVKRLRGPLVYFYAVIHTLITFQPPWMRVVYDGGTFEGKVMFTVVNNLPRFGGGMRIAPDAKIDDGLLDLVIVREIPKPTLLSVFPKVYSGKHVSHPAVLMARTRRAEITIDRAMTMYGGGEPLRPVAAGEPVVVEVVPGGLRVVG